MVLQLLLLFLSRGTEWFAGRERGGRTVARKKVGENNAKLTCNRLIFIVSLPFSMKEGRHSLFIWHGDYCQKMMMMWAKDVLLCSSMCSKQHWRHRRRQKANSSTDHLAVHLRQLLRSNSCRKKAMKWYFLLATETSLDVICRICAAYCNDNDTMQCYILIMFSKHSDQWHTHTNKRQKVFVLWRQLASYVSLRLSVPFYAPKLSFALLK